MKCNYCDAIGNWDIHQAEPICDSCQDILLSTGELLSKDKRRHTTLIELEPKEVKNVKSNNIVRIFQQPDDMLFKDKYTGSFFTVAEIKMMSADYGKPEELDQWLERFEIANVPPVS